MSKTSASATGRLRAIGFAGAVTATSYVVLGSVLLWSRLVGLDRGYASDEARTVREFVREGPHQILFGDYVPNNHELFSLLAWATRAVVGESEIAFRLWSALPFVAGAIVVTAWLHRRVGALSGLLFLFLATMSPLLLDITRQARGYGLAFLAMAVMTVAALEAGRSQGKWTVPVFCIAGFVGAATLPVLGIAFVATGAVLLASPELRRPAAGGLAASVATLVLFYAPHLDDVLARSRQQYGARIDGAWVLTAPIDQVLIPSLVWIDETLMNPGLGSLVFVGALALVLGSSPLLERRHEALVLTAGVVVTVATLWVTRTHVAPRFLSFLLVPLFVLLATGLASILARFATTVRAGLRIVIAAATLALFTIVSLSWMGDIARLPRESVESVASTIRSTAPPPARVFAHIPYPRDLEHNLGRPVEAVRTPAQMAAACAQPGRAVVVTQPWILEPVTIPCERRPGARHYRFEQYARGRVVDVWVLPGRT